MKKRIIFVLILASLFIFDSLFCSLSSFAIDNRESSEIISLKLKKQNFEDFASNLKKTVDLSTEWGSDAFEQILNSGLNSGLISNEKMKDLWSCFSTINRPDASEFFLEAVSRCIQQNYIYLYAYYNLKNIENENDRSIVLESIQKEALRQNLLSNERISKIIHDLESLPLKNENLFQNEFNKIEAFCANSDVLKLEHEISPCKSHFGRTPLIWYSDKGKYNDYKNDYNMDMRYYNCYGHATGIHDLNIPGKISGIDIISGYKKYLLHIGRIREAVVADLNRLGYKARYAKNAQDVRPGETLIAVRKGQVLPDFIDDLIEDFHFSIVKSNQSYFLNNTHKPGRTAVITAKYTSDNKAWPFESYHVLREDEYWALVFNYDGYDSDVLYVAFKQ